jgi:hypothetical protein
MTAKAVMTKAIGRIHGLNFPNLDFGRRVEGGFMSNSVVGA